MKKSKIIEEGFTSLEAGFIPKSANKIQRYDMKMSFFAGASWVLNTLYHAGVLEKGSERKVAKAMELEARAFMEELDEKMEALMASRRSTKQ